jgi:hypothetical protein
MFLGVMFLWGHSSSGILPSSLPCHPPRHPTCCGPDTPQLKLPGSFVMDGKSALWRILQIPGSLWPHLVWENFKFSDAGSPSSFFCPLEPDGIWWVPSSCPHEAAWVGVGVETQDKVSSCSVGLPRSTWALLILSNPLCSCPWAPPLSFTWGTPYPTLAKSDSTVNSHKQSHELNGLWQKQQVPFCPHSTHPPQDRGDLAASSLVIWFGGWWGF